VGAYSSGCRACGTACAARKLMSTSTWEFLPKRRVDRVLSGTFRAFAKRYSLRLCYKEIVWDSDRSK